jgi:hypothetical protein
VVRVISKFKKPALPWMLSVAFHVLIFVRFVEPNLNHEDRVLTPPIKVRVVSSGDKRPRAVVSSEKPKQVQQKLVVSPETPKNPISSYTQLLPSRFPDGKISSSVNDPMRGAAEANEEFAETSRDLSKLIIFGRDLADIIAVPSGLKEIQKNGSGRVQISRSGVAGWKVTRATGDSYVRALLYDTLAGMDPKTYRSALGSGSDVSVIFSYQAVSVLDPAIDPVQVVVDGNRIYITETYLWIPPYWQMLSAGPAGGLGVNLIGVGMYLAKPFLDKDVDPDFERLKLSPAFIRPLGK